jgi:hypothetical protein
MADRAIEQPARSALAVERQQLATTPVRALMLTSTQRTALMLALTVAAVFAVQAPVLGHYFFNDDFVPLADIASRTNTGYVRDLFLMDDLTPNWRFLTGIVYLIEYRAFGLDPLPYLTTAVVVHCATAGLVFWLVRRATGNDWTALLAGGLFGLSAASVPTVGQITAFNNVLATFFVMLAIVLLYEALDRTAIRALLCAGAALAFACAIASNESSAIVAPVFGLVAIWRVATIDRWREAGVWIRVAVVSAPFALLGSAALIGFSACQCTEAELYSRDTLIENLWLYFGRLLYPIGLEFPGYVGTAHMVAGPVVLATALVALVLGPALARIAAVFLFLAVIPYLPIDLWAASRYTYLASAPFAILAAVLVGELVRLSSRIVPALPALVTAVALGALGLHAWQTWTQNADQAEAAERWRQLVSAVDAAYADVPPRSTVYVRGGPIEDPFARCAVMPAVGNVLWGDAMLFTFPEDEPRNYRALPGYNVYVANYEDGRVVQQPIAEATAAELDSSNVFLLPHVSPAATGNLCQPGVPRIP